MRVVDLSETLAGPFCAMTLADMRAEVGKTSVVLDLKDAHGSRPAP
jgi:hypothetical protein